MILLYEWTTHGKTAYLNGTGFKKVDTEIEAEHWIEVTNDSYRRARPGEGMNTRIDEAVLVEGKRLL